jgi:hypothetical protein
VGCIKMYREKVMAQTTTGAKCRRCSITSLRASVVEGDVHRNHRAKCQPSNSHRFDTGVHKIPAFALPLRTRAMVLSTAVALKGLCRYAM